MPSKATIPSICAACGREFLAKHTEVNRGGGKYCCSACWQSVKGALRTGSKRSDESRARMSAAAKTRKRTMRKPPVVVTCIHCGVVKTYTVQRGKARDMRFCSRVCWYAYFREHPEAHPHFRPGAPPRYGWGWPAIAREARERDNHTCQSCGLRQTRPQLHVHHVRPLRAFNGDLDAAHAPSNLTTLCKACHRGIENRTKL